MRENNLYKKKLLFTTVIFLLLLIVIGFLKNKSSASETMRKYFWTNKVHSKKKYNIIFIGDSRIYRGIDTKEIKNGFKNDDIDVLNFGFSSGGHNKKIFLEAENKLKKESPQIIVLGITPYSLTPKAQLNEHYYEEKNRSKGDVLERIYFYPLLSFFDPYNLQEIVFPSSAKYIEKFSENGFVKSHKKPANPEEALASYQKEFIHNKVNQKILEEIFSQVKIWNNKGIAVYAFRPPTTKKMEELENKISGFNEFTFIENFELNGGRWILIENRYGYNSFDGSHLHYISAQQLSNLIGEKIKDDFYRIR